MTLEDEIKTKKFANAKIRAALNVSFTSYWLNDQWSAIFKQFDLSQPQYNVLRILRGQKGQAINLMDIQGRMIQKSSNTTRLVDRLLQKNLVERITCEENRRKVEISITKQGLELLAEIDPLLSQHEARIFKKFTIKDAEHLNLLLNKLRSAMA
jgi:DNA-binding MarR family transcriptional regulator